MLKNISLFTVFFSVIALVSGDTDRLIHGLAVMHGLTFENLFEPAQFWILLHYSSLGLALLLVLIDTMLLLRKQPINVNGLTAMVCLDLLLMGHLVFDGLSAAIQQPQMSAVIHELLGYATVWYAYAMLLRIRPARLKKSPQSGIRSYTTILMFLLLISLIVGIWASVNNSATVCPDIKLCVNQWWASLDWASLSNTIAVFLNGQLQPLSPEALPNLLVWHDVLAGLAVLMMTLLVIYGLSTQRSPAIRKALVSLLLLLLLEPVLGFIELKTGIPAALAHSVVGAFLMLPLVAIRFFSRYEYVTDQATVVLAEPEPVQEVSQKPVSEADYQEPAPETLYLRLKSQLKKTRSGLGQVLSGITFGQRKPGADLLEELETQLIMADLGMDATNTVIKGMTDKLERQQLNDGDLVLATLKNELLTMLQPCSQPLVIPEQDKPYVILVVGINGVGKTTTIGKMAKRLQAQGHSVMLAAGDTFRAAAVEQLQVWGQRNNIHVVAQHTGADSASVIYDGVQSALAKGVDVLIADTAGRLHTKSNLMDELKKVKRIMAKLDDTAPHEVLLVLDAGTGQNAISQTALFNETVGLTGLVLTKLDGTAKGGILFALAKQFGIPIRYIGVGEGIDDLQDFNAANFVDALFVKDE